MSSSHSECRMHVWRWCSWDSWGSCYSWITWWWCLEQLRSYMQERSCRASLHQALGKRVHQGSGIHWAQLGASLQHYNKITLLCCKSLTYIHSSAFCIILTYEFRDFVAVQQLPDSIQTKRWMHQSKFQTSIRSIVQYLLLFCWLLL